MYLCLARRPFFSFRLRPKVDGALRLATGEGGGRGRISLWIVGTCSSSEGASFRFKGPSSPDDPVVSPLKYINVVMNVYFVTSISISRKIF